MKERRRIAGLDCEVDAQTEMNGRHTLLIRGLGVMSNGATFEEALKNLEEVVAEQLKGEDDG